MRDVLPRRDDQRDAIVRFPGSPRVRVQSCRSGSRRFADDPKGEHAQAADGLEVARVRRVQGRTDRSRGESDEDVVHERSSAYLAAAVPEGAEHEASIVEHIARGRDQPIRGAVRPDELVEQASRSLADRAGAKLHLHPRAQMADQPGTDHDHLTPTVGEPVDVDAGVEQCPRHRRPKTSSNPPMARPRRSTRTIRSSASTMSSARSSVSCSVFVSRTRRARSIFRWSSFRCLCRMATN
jgi:hypothetical protein